MMLPLRHHASALQVEDSWRPAPRVVGLDLAVGHSASLIALVVLMIGQVLPDARLTVDPIPVNTVLMVVAAVVAFLLPAPKRQRSVLPVMLLFLAPLCVTLIWSRDAEAGANKLLILLASTVIAVMMLLHSIDRIGLRSCFRGWVVASLALLVGALVYKAQHGFFDRDVNFLLNGPNVFSRQMGLAAVLAAFLWVGPKRVALVALFSLAVLWTQSKGPLLMLMVVGLYYAFRGTSPGGRIAIGSLLLLAALGVYAMVDLLREVPMFSRIFLAVSFMDSSHSDENFGSIGSRMLLAKSALDMIWNAPLGIGMGAWMSMSGFEWSEYPHNIFLELFCEGGILLGSIALVPYFLFVRSSCKPLVALCWFLAGCQQFSGSLADSRFWLTLSAVAYAYVAAPRPATGALHYDIKG